MSQQENKCPVEATRKKLIHFYNDNSKDGMCSKCHPCKLGIFDAIKILEAIQAGNGRDKDVVLLKRIAADVKDGGMCKKGKDHADILSAFLAASTADLEHHIKGVCSYRECKQLITYEIDPALCTVCDKCRAACKDNAIEGQKMIPGKTGFTPYRIRQRRCTHCGECIKVCPENAVVIVEKDREADQKEPVRTLVCTCDVSGKATGHAPACAIHDTVGAVR
ncbi:MAG TPA: NADH-ubiquinone oxidoreductase-F iron-sulfur binding region domain-containing protein [Nitrospirota bacterium]|nr:NADH-ubiquinone oxidoreductase-F iron-sulfur binding region domain-containing protein [Nitrospirota bacterium]